MMADVATTHNKHSSRFPGLLKLDSYSQAKRCVRSGVTVIIVARTPSHQVPQYVQKLVHCKRGVIAMHKEMTVLNTKERKKTVIKYHTASFAESIVGNLFKLTAHRNFRRKYAPMWL